MDADSAFFASGGGSGRDDAIEARNASCCACSALGFGGGGALTRSIVLCVVACAVSFACCSFVISFNKKKNFC